MKKGKKWTGTIRVKICANLSPSGILYAILNPEAPPPPRSTDRPANGPKHEPE